MLHEIKGNMNICKNNYLSKKAITSLCNPLNDPLQEAFIRFIQKKDLSWLWH